MKNKSEECWDQRLHQRRRHLADLLQNKAGNKLSETATIFFEGLKQLQSYTLQPRQLELMLFLIST